MSFISERRVFKHLAKDRVDILEVWPEVLPFGRGNTIAYPAVIKLKYHVRWIPRRIKFCRTSVIKRDRAQCQYCGVALNRTNLTMDHIIPQTRGGANDWRNCVAACFNCNNKKGNRTPEEAAMPLLRKPSVPIIDIVNEIRYITPLHESWRFYVPNYHLAFPESVQSTSVLVS